MSADLKDASVPLAEISQAPSSFDAFLDRNQKGIVVFTILLALGAAGLVIQRGLKSSQQESAGNALSKSDSIESLKSVVLKHDGTHAAGSALVLLANAQWTDGNQDDAIASLRKFLGQYPKHPAVPTAKASLGSKLAAQGKSGDATEVLEEIVTDPAARYIAPFALLTLGDLARASGDLEKAENHYNQVKVEFPETTFVSAAGSRILMLKAKPPTEIAPPPVPTPVTPPSDTPPAPVPAIPSESPSTGEIPVETPPLPTQPELPLPENSATPESETPSGTPVEP